MVFSSTSPIPGTSDVAGGGVLFHAWESVRRARELAWDTAAPETWLEDFRHEMTGARALLLAHIAAAEAPSSRLFDVPTEPGAVSREFDEHAKLLADMDQILAAANDTGHGAVDRVVDVTERAILLEIRIAIHHNRLHALLYPEPATGRARQGVAG